MPIDGPPCPRSSLPFWSADSNGWVAAIELRRGERLLEAGDSTPRVVSFTLRAEPAVLYNIDVDGEHSYRVGQQGLLVHNMSAPATPPSGNTNPAPATPHFTCQELLDIVNAAPVNATGVTAGGPAGGKMVRIGVHSEKVFMVMSTDLPLELELVAQEA